MNTTPEGTPLGSHPETQAAYVMLVNRIQGGDQTAVADLSRLFARGVRFLLTKRLRSQDVEQELQAVLSSVEESIKKKAVKAEQLQMLVLSAVRKQPRLLRDESSMRFTDRFEKRGGRQASEYWSILEAQTALITTVLETLSTRDIDLLTRYYVLEETAESICGECVVDRSDFNHIIVKLRSMLRTAKEAGKDGTAMSSGEFSKGGHA